MINNLNPTINMVKMGEPTDSTHIFLCIVIIAPMPDNPNIA